MTQYEISDEALQMAWTMVKTIVLEHDVSPRDQSVLLTLTTGIALDDLLNDGSVQWTTPPLPQQILLLKKDSIQLKTATTSRATLKTKYTPEEIEKSAQTAETLFDSYLLTEEERAALFTALPCLGLHALQSYVGWLREPPFAELGN